MMKKPPVDERTLAAARFVRQGSRIADVGCDHAYCAIYLCTEGICRGGVCSDIRPGPLSRAEENIRLYGMTSLLHTKLCDGLEGLETEEPDDILIMGMGGETVAGILERASFVRDEHIRLILQPMTQQDVLRRWLCENGFAISDEAVCTAGDKRYQIICAGYTGKKAELSDAALWLGEHNIKRYLQGDGTPQNDCFAAMLAHRIDVTEKQYEGLCRAGEDASVPQRLLCELYRIRERRNGTE